jgi:hypothetical protein
MAEENKDAEMADPDEKGLLTSEGLLKLYLKAEAEEKCRKIGAWH